MERRNFLSGAAVMAAGLALLKEAAAQTAPTPEPQKLVTQLWSRHLQWVSTQAEAQSDAEGAGIKIGNALRQAGYAAVDLTVRNDGHVRPENVATVLPAMLKGIRSTGAICDHIGVNFAPPADPNNTQWIASQFVHEILSVAAANGIKRYRFNNSGAVNFAANTYGDAMTALLDAVRVNHQRLAAINTQYGGLCGVAHTHSNNIGTTVYDYEYSMRDIDPNLIAINFATSHTVGAARGSTWQLELRRHMPRIKCTAVEDMRAAINATTGAVSTSTIEPNPATAGGGLINWTTFYQLLLNGGYSGAAESQIEYTIPDAIGGTISLNSAFFADNAAFTSGRLTPAMMIATMKNASDFIRARAAAAGWGQNGTQVI
jgi:sugar phosphate isomerase/epimerase